MPHRKHSISWKTEQVQSPCKEFWFTFSGRQCLMQHRAVTVRISILNKPSQSDILDVNTPPPVQNSVQTSHASDEPISIVEEHIPAKDSSDRLVTPYPDMTPKQIMGRQYQVISFPVDSTFTSQVLKFPRDLAAFKAIECGCASFKYLRAGVRLTIRIQSTISQSGLMSVSWLPMEGPPLVDPYQATGNNSVLLNYSTQDSVQMDIPWLNPLSWGRTDEDASICTVYFHPIVPLRAPATSEDSITVVVFAQYINPELTGPQVAQSSEQYQRGVISTVAEPVFQVMDAVENGVSGVSKLLGLLDKPDAPTNTRFVNTNMSDTNSFLSSDTVVPSVPYSVTGPHLLPNKYNLFPYGHSSMTMTALAARPMLTASKVVTALGDRLEISLNPFLPRTVDTVAADDYLSLIAGTCRYFRGSTKYFVHFCTDQYTSCRFRIGVTYGAWTTATLSSGDTISRVVDVKGSTSTSVLIPYLCQTPWSTKASVFPNFYVAAVTAPIGQALPATSTITVTVYRAGGPDTQFAYPSNEGSSPPPTVPFGPQQAQTSLNSHFSSSFPPIVEGVHIGKEFGSSVTNVLTSPSQVLKTFPVASMPLADLADFPFKSTHYFLERFFPCFSFWRGSIRCYHTRFPETGISLRSAFLTNDGVTPSLLSETALPHIPLRLPEEADGVTLTLPWYSTVPYMPNDTSQFAPFLDKPVFSFTQTPLVGHIYVYPGDDFVLGHLRAPPVMI